MMQFLIITVGEPLQVTAEAVEEAGVVCSNWTPANKIIIALADGRFN